MKREPPARDGLALEGPSEEAGRAESSAVPSQIRPGILPFAVLGFLVAAAAEMLNGLFPVIATEYAGLSDAQAGIVYTVSTLAIIVSGPLFGWLSDNVSHKLVLSIRGAANTLSSILYLVGPSFAGIAAARTVDDLGKAAFRPAWGALMARVSSHDRRNRARSMSWMSMGEDAGATLAPILAGFLWSAWGITMLMGVRALLALGTEAYAIIVARVPGEATTARKFRAPSRVGQPPTSPPALRNAQLQHERAGGEP